MHSLVIIIGHEDIAEAMAPYSGNIEVEEWCQGEVLDERRRQMLDYYINRGYSFESFDACYADKGKDWNNNAWRKDDDGVWREYSTYNPNSQWDWYEIGGRWAGRLQLKEGAEPLAPINFSWGWGAPDKQKVLDMVPKRADQAYLKDIANADDLYSGAVIINGEWIDTSEGFDFLNISDYLKDLPGDTLITCVDYHI